MSQWADGGIVATKPYVSSALILIKWEIIAKIVLMIRKKGQEKCMSI